MCSFICSSNNNISRITSMVQSAARHFSPPLLSYNLPSSEPSHSTPLPYHPFPPPSAFACPSVIPILRDLGFGYRAPFIQRTAAMLVEEHTDVDPEEWLRELRGWEVEMAREELLRFVGVGRKVADCVLLMSLDKVGRVSAYFVLRSVFLVADPVFALFPLLTLRLGFWQNAIIPVDVHVHQIAQRLYSFKATGAKRSSTGEKVPMTPKLYEEVQNALSARWGDMGGWTQAVRFPSVSLSLLLASSHLVALASLTLLSFRPSADWRLQVLFASDLPFLLSSLAPNSTKPLKQPMIRSSLLLPTASTSSLTPNSILGEQGLVAMPASLLESSSPPETKPSVAAGRLAFESGKSSTARVRKKRGVGEEGVRLKVKVKVEVGVVVKREEREGDETSGLEEVRREAEEGGSLGEKAKRRRRNA